MRLASVILVLAALIATAASVQARVIDRPAADPGVSAHTIKLGGDLDQTNVGSIIARPILGGYQLAVDQINAAGGINGRKVDYTYVSDNYDPSQTLPMVKQLVEADGVFAVLGVFGTQESNVAAPYLEAHSVPFFDAIGGMPHIAGLKWVWQTEPSPALEGQVIARYVATTLHARRVGVVYQIGFGEPQLAALKKTLPKYGGSVVADAPYQPTDTNLSAQVIRMRAANPDIVVLNGTPTPTAAFLQYARLQSFRPKAGYIANYPMSDPLWLALIGANGEGNHVSSYADLTGHNKVAAAYRKAIDQYHGERYSNYGLYGYFNAMLFFKALTMTGKHLTRAGLRTVLDTKFRNYDTGFAGHLTWTPKQHYGSRQFKMYLIKSGQLVPVTGWISR